MRTTEMRLHPRSPFFGLYSSRFYIEKLKGTMTTCIIVIVPMWLFTPPLIQFLSRSMNDSKSTPHFHFEGCHFHFRVPHFHFRGYHFHFGVPHLHFTLNTSCQTYVV